MGAVQKILESNNSILTEEQGRCVLSVLLPGDDDFFRCKDGKFRIVYLTVNCIDGTKYIGRHTTKNIKDRYFGSGVNYKKAEKLFGKENFEKGLLEYCKSNEELKKKEREWVQFFKVKGPIYNIIDGGGNGIGFWQDKKFSEEHKNNLKINHADFSGENHPMFGKHHTEESNQKNREHNLGKHIGENSPNFGKPGWSKGLTKDTDERLKKYSETLANRPMRTCPYCGLQSNNIGNMVQYHFDNCKKKPRYFRTK